MNVNFSKELFGVYSKPLNSILGPMHKLNRIQNGAGNCKMEYCPSMEMPALASTKPYTQNISDKKFGSSKSTGSRYGIISYISLENRCCLCLSDPIIPLMALL